jgi:phosphoribosylformylglycinamidine cyclo-ligase
MRRTFNLGIGLILAVPPDDTESVLALAASEGERAVIMGRIVSE